MDVDGQIEVRFIRNHGDRAAGDRKLVTGAEARALEAQAIAIRVRAQPVRRPITEAHTVTKPRR